MWKPNPTEYAKFREALRTARKDADMTQAEVAERLGCPQSVIAKYENGERRVDVVEFLALAKAIGFDPGRFVRKLAGRSRT